MRSAEEILARARILNLVASRAQGVSAELLRPELFRHGLGIWLTQDEHAWLNEDAPMEGESPIEAVLALAWALGLTRSLDAHDPKTYGSVQDQLDERSLRAPTLRDEADVRAKLAESQDLERRRALRWALGEPDWPVGGEAEPISSW